jgi:hypothetical protein
VIVALAQWPVAVALFAWNQEGSRLGRGLALGLAAAAVLLAAAPLRSRRAALPLLVAALLLAPAYVLAMQGWSFVVPLLLAGVTFAAASLGVFAAGARGASLAALALGACVFLAAGAEIVRARFAHSAGSFDNVIQQPDPVLTWRLIPFAEQHHVGRDAGGGVEFDVTYHIDGEGTRVVPGRPGAGPKWLVLGASFVFGLGVGDDDTLPARLQALRPDRRVVNLGVNGYGPGDVALYLPQRLRDPEEIELCLYVMIEDHFRRAENHYSVTMLEWGRYKPRLRVEDGELRYVGPAYESLGFLGKLDIDLHETSFIYSAVTPPWSLRPPAMELTRAMILDMERRTSERGARFVLAIGPQVDPSQPRMQELDAWIADLRGRGVTVLDYRGRFFEALEPSGETLDDYFLSNYHPRRAYNERIAGWLDADLR